MENLQVTLTFGNCEISVKQQDNDIQSLNYTLRRLITLISPPTAALEDDDMVKRQLNDDLDFDRLCDK